MFQVFTEKIATAMMTKTPAPPVIRTPSYAEALTSFGFTFRADPSLAECEAVWTEWKNDPTRNKDEIEFQAMTCAYHVLTAKKIKAAWAQYSPAAMPLKEALDFFGEVDRENPTPSHVPSQQSLNITFEERSRGAIGTIADAQTLDAAYSTLYQHATPNPYSEDQPMLAPSLLRFQHIIAKEKAAGWDSPKVGKWTITNKEAHAIFGIDDVGQLRPPDVTTVFSHLQSKCTTIKEAERLDEAYRWLYMICCNYEKDITAPMASPYAPELAEKLGIVVPPPVAIETPAPLVAVATPEIVPVTRNPIVKPPTLSVVAAAPKPVEPPSELVSDMGVEEARVFLNLGKTERFTRPELDFRYQKISDANDSKALQEDIDQAYGVLKGHLEQPYQQAKKRFDYGSTDIITEEDLDDRYTRLSKATDSKAEQKKIDTAYQVLLKIAV